LQTPLNNNQTKGRKTEEKNATWNQKHDTKTNEQEKNIVNNLHT